MNNLNQQLLSHLDTCNASKKRLTFDDTLPEVMSRNNVDSNGDIIDTQTFSSLECKFDPYDLQKYRKLEDEGEDD